MRRGIDLGIWAQASRARLEFLDPRRRHWTVRYPSIGAFSNFSSILGGHRARIISRLNGRGCNRSERLLRWFFGRRTSSSTREQAVCRKCRTGIDNALVRVAKSWRLHSGAAAPLFLGWPVSNLQRASNWHFGKRNKAQPFSWDASACSASLSIPEATYLRCSQNRVRAWRSQRAEFRVGRVEPIEGVIREIMGTWHEN